MKAPTSLRQAFLTRALFAFLFTTLVLGTRASTDVRISGRLYADGAPLTDAVLVVELNDNECLESILLPNGKFEFHVPAGSNARLVFLKPGFLTKEVLVDTRNAMPDAHEKYINKNVKFEVELEPTEEHMHEVYLGPVGYINFLKGSGLMKVRHDMRTMPVVIPGEQQVAVKP